jgi:2-(1,2-epoxy-1,2-dihydrophenyl)acetyl-CoA isomerase
MAYTRAGLAPDGSSTYFLSKLIGMRRAKELALTNRVLSAAEALEWGLINRVVPDAELAAAAGELAISLAEGATLALGEAKRLIQQGFTETLESQMERETRAIADMARTEDAREGIAAFIAKRKPDFKGR